MSRFFIGKVKIFRNFKIGKIEKLDVRRKWQFNDSKDNRNWYASCSDSVMLNSQPITITQYAIIKMAVFNICEKFILISLTFRTGRSWRVLESWSESGLSKKPKLESHRKFQISPGTLRPPTLVCFTVHPSSNYPSLQSMTSISPKNVQFCD